MPALITHDTFGRDVYDHRHSFIGGTRDEADAFLLGNQGPDPLFYSVLSPRLHAVHRLGNRMHNEKPSELLEAFKQSLFVLKEGERGIGRAYALGFLCHYLLDSTMHPFVFFQEYQACGRAGSRPQPWIRGARRHRKRVRRAGAVHEARRDHRDVRPVARGAEGERPRAGRGVQDVRLRGADAVRDLHSRERVRLVREAVPPGAGVLLFAQGHQAGRGGAHRGSGAPALVLPRHEPSLRRAGGKHVRQPGTCPVEGSVHRRGQQRRLLGTLRQGAGAHRCCARGLRPRRLRRGGGACHHGRPGLLG